DAVAQAGRGRAVGEDVAQMRVAHIAQYLGADHAVAGVGFFTHFGRVERLKVAGPAAAGVEFGVGRKQRGTATDTAIDAGCEGVPVAAGERAFGALASNDVIFFGRQERLPFLFGTGDLFHAADSFKDGKNTC